MRKIKEPCYTQTGIVQFSMDHLICKVQSKGKDLQRIQHHTPVLYILEEIAKLENHFKR